ncbi:MAG: hypothetical protein ACTSSP_04280 [Candidatus Asgardarchaeia archaeon]
MDSEKEKKEARRRARKRAKYRARFIRKLPKHLARIGRRKKRAKIFSEIPKKIKVIDIESLYYPYREWQDPFLKYWREDGDNVLRIGNSPWATFVRDYLRMGLGVLENLDNHVLTKWAIETFIIAKKNIDNIHTRRLKKGNQALKSASRLIELTESIKKHGYCQGEYNNDGNLINVVRGYVSPDGSKGYKLLWGNRRAAVCAGIVLKKIRVKCWDSYGAKEVEQ